MLTETETMQMFQAVMKLDEAYILMYELVMKQQEKVNLLEARLDSLVMEVSNDKEGC